MNTRQYQNILSWKALASQLVDGRIALDTFLSHESVKDLDPSLFWHYLNWASRTAVARQWEHNMERAIPPYKNRPGFRYAAEAEAEAREILLLCNQMILFRQTRFPLTLNPLPMNEDRDVLMRHWSHINSLLKLPRNWSPSLVETAAGALLMAQSPQNMHGIFSPRAILPKAMMITTTNAEMLRQQEWCSQQGTLSLEGFDVGQIVLPEPAKIAREHLYWWGSQLYHYAMEAERTPPEEQVRQWQEEGEEGLF